MSSPAFAALRGTAADTYLVLDENRNPITPGEIGELYIGGIIFDCKSLIEHQKTVNVVFDGSISEHKFAELELDCLFRG